MIRPDTEPKDIHVENPLDSRGHKKAFGYFRVKYYNKHKSNPWFLMYTF